MKPHQLFTHKPNEIVKLSLISLFLIFSLVLKAQTPTDFSGKWEFDKVRSDKAEVGDASFNGTIILEINQNQTTIAFVNTFIMPGKKPFVMKPDSFFLDGKVTADNSGTGSAKKFVKWSQDKKILTTSFVMTDSIDGVAQDFLTSNTFKLSDDKNTLTIEEFHKSKLNGEKTIKKVYSKKL